MLSDPEWLESLNREQRIIMRSYERGKHGTKVLQLLDMDIEWGREYDLLLAVEGSTVKSFVDKQPVSNVNVNEDLTGKISLGTYGPHAIARFRDPMIRYAQNTEHLPARYTRGGTYHLI